jgi:hypothetical protein
VYDNSQTINHVHVFYGLFVYSLGVFPRYTDLDGQRLKTKTFAPTTTMEQFTMAKLKVL